MAYLGNNLTVQQYAPQIAYFQGNGSTTSFTLPLAVVSAGQILVTVNNVVQNPDYAYTVSGSTLTFTSAPSANSTTPYNIWVEYTSLQTNTVVPAYGTVGTSQLANGTVVTTADATIHGLTVGLGGGSVSTNTVVGASALSSNSSGAYNNAFGGNDSVFGPALYANTTGSNNNAFGNGALSKNTTGGSNTAIGHEALVQNTTASSNTAVGYQSLYANTQSYNTAIGYAALYNNTTGANNTALGFQSLVSNTTASDNTAVGYQAGYSNTTGNVDAFGFGSLKANTTGSYNAGFGFGSLFTNTTGSYNVGFGAGALQFSTTASNNTAVGYQAGYNTTTGASNIFIGYSANPNAATDNNCIVIGVGAGGQGSNTTRIATYSSGYGNVYQGNNSTVWAITSDQRLKKNIVDNTVGLDAITKIKVRNFEYRLPQEVTDLPQTSAINIQGVQLGAIAQELAQVLPDCVKTESTGVMSVDTTNITWHLINAVKELNATVTAQAAQIAALQAKVGS